MEKEFSFLKFSHGDIIARARARLMKEKPFFGYLLSASEIVEDPEVGTAQIDEQLRIAYNGKFIETMEGDLASISDKTTGLLLHEILHVALNHLSRIKGRSARVKLPDGRSYPLYYIAADVVINNMLVNERISLPEVGIIPCKNKVTVLGVKIQNINTKSAEDIYEELLSLKGKKLSEEEAESLQPNENDWEGLLGKSKSKEKSAANKKADRWKEIVAEAKNYSKIAGNSSMTSDSKEFKAVYKKILNWSSLIQKEVSKGVSSDVSWTVRNRNYVYNDYFVPGPIGEKVVMLFAIDVSSSMGMSDLKLIMDTIYSISKKYVDIEFRILTHNVNVLNDFRIEGQHVSGEIKKIKIELGGGTSHISLYSYIREKRYDKRTKLLVSFTDGFSEYPKKELVRTVFVLTGLSVEDRANIPFGKVIRMEPTS